MLRLTQHECDTLRAWLVAEIGCLGESIASAARNGDYEEGRAAWEKLGRYLAAQDEVSTTPAEGGIKTAFVREVNEAVTDYKDHWCRILDTPEVKRAEQELEFCQGILERCEEVPA